MPMMFITRVRLRASTFSAISVKAISRSHELYVEKTSDPRLPFDMGIVGRRNS
jgi:hypothetical protein